MILQRERIKSLKESFIIYRRDAINLRTYIMCWKWTTTPPSVIIYHC